LKDENTHGAREGRRRRRSGFRSTQF